MRITCPSLIALLIWSSNCFAMNVAQCSNPSGKSFFPYLGIMSEKEAGWANDKISGGITTLNKLDNGQYDILFVDATKQITSSQSDGGRIVQLSRGKTEASFLVIYPGRTAEIYTFYVDNAGKAKYTMVTHRSGSLVLFSKVSVMSGDCDFVRLNLIN